MNNGTGAVSITATQTSSQSPRAVANIAKGVLIVHAEPLPKAEPLESVKAGLPKKKVFLLARVELGVVYGPYLAAFVPRSPGKPDVQRGERACVREVYYVLLGPQSLWRRRWLLFPSSRKMLVSTVVQEAALPAIVTAA